jgi:hypothetical protein
MTAADEQRDQTLTALSERLASRRIAASRSALSRFFQRRAHRLLRRSILGLWS